MTTVKSSAHPVSDVDFPSLILCAPGMNDDVLTAGFIKEFFNYLKSKRKISVEMTPLQAVLDLRNVILSLALNPPSD